MRISVRRALTISLTTVATVGLWAGSAQAAATATTLPATSQTTTSALLNGSVATHGSKTIWEFQYGRTRNYGLTTEAVEIPAGQGTVEVSASVSGLQPGTGYHFRLVAESNIDQAYLQLAIAVGQDLGFGTQSAGRLALSGSSVSVRRGRPSIGLRCSSVLSCRGQFSLTVRVRVHHRWRTYTLGGQSFFVLAGRRRTFGPKLSSFGLGLLQHARHHRLGVHLTAALSTGQPKFSQGLTLILR